MHLTENEILLYLEGKISKQRRREMEAHFSECSECTFRLSELFSLKKDVDQTQIPDLDIETRKKALSLIKHPEADQRLSRPKLFLMYSTAVLVIAMISVFFIYRSNIHEIQPRVYRGSNLTDSAIHLFPAENSSIPSSSFHFRWDKVKNAVQYRVTVFDESGNILLNEMSVDTTLIFDSYKLLNSGKTYLWRVEAYYPDGRSETSSLYSFKYTPK